jgi:hypothetical protein
MTIARGRRRSGEGTRCGLTVPALQRAMETPVGLPRTAAHQIRSRAGSALASAGDLATQRSSDSAPRVAASRTANESLDGERTRYRRGEDRSLACDLRFCWFSGSGTQLTALMPARRSSDLIYISIVSYSGTASGNWAALAIRSVGEPRNSIELSIRGPLGLSSGALAAVMALSRRRCAAYSHGYGPSPARSNHDLS